jgi:hypothetical protein
VYSVLQGH